MLYKFQTFSIMLLFPLCSFADVLILNFNMNNSTVEQVYKYAKTNNLNIAVYPNESLELINKTTIETILDEVKSSDIKTLIISGHSTPGSFSGKSGELKQGDLLAELNKHESLTSTIENLILRGCYTTRLNEILARSQWRSSLPNLRYISGYNGRAWSSETQLSRNYILDTLQSNESFTKAETPQEAITLFKGVRNFDKSALALWFKTEENEYYITSETLNQNKPIINFNKIRNTCNLNTEIRLEYNSLLEKYDSGDLEGFERPPADTNKGELRKIYEWLLKNQHCITLQIWDENPYDDVDKAAGLLFFNRLTHNYQNTYNQDEFKMLLDAYSSAMEYSIAMPDLKSSSRNDIRKFTYNLGTAIYNKNTNGLVEKLDRYSLSRLDYHLNGMNNLIVNIDTSLIPSRWLTEDNTYAQPLFLLYKSNASSAFITNKSR